MRGPLFHWPISFTPPAGEVRKVFKMVSRLSRANAAAINYNGIKEGRYKREGNL